MEEEIGFLSKLQIIRDNDPELIIKNEKSKIPPYYKLLRFWGRIPPYILDDIFSSFKGKFFFDPFGGSGSAIFKALEYNVPVIVYNDINPVFKFIVKTIYESLFVSRNDIKKYFEKLMKNIFHKSQYPKLVKFNRHVISRINYDSFISLRNRQEYATMEIFKAKLMKKISKKIITILRKQNTISFTSLRTQVLKRIRDEQERKIAKVLFSKVLRKLLEDGWIKQKSRPTSMVVSTSLILPQNLQKIPINDNVYHQLCRKEKDLQKFITHDVFLKELKYSNGKFFLKAEGAKSISDLFTRWSKIGLSILWNKINEIKNIKLQNIFKFERRCWKG